MLCGPDYFAVYWVWVYGSDEYEHDVAVAESTGTHVSSTWLQLSSGSLCPLGVPSLPWVRTSHLEPPYFCVLGVPGH